jgi:hypothetical protein
MKSIPPWTAADGLTTISLLRARNRAKDPALTFDLVAILDPFCDHSLRGTEDQSRQHWLHHCLPKAFPEARIIPFGYVQHDHLVSGTVADIEAFNFNVLKQLLQLRQSTKTVRVPLLLFSDSRAQPFYEPAVAISMFIVCFC